jgi:ligand-binding sensor domain-containing protein
MTQYAIASWQRRDGLPQRSVVALAQTRDGYLWVGTEEGVARFDGTRFRVYDSSNTPALVRSNVSTLVASRRDGLWIGTIGGGLVWTDGERFRRYTVADGLAQDIVSSVLEDRDGTLWVGTFDKGVSRLVGGRFVSVTTREGLSSDEIRALRQTEDGSIWVGTHGGGVNRVKDGRVESWTTATGLSHDQVTSLCPDGAGGMWIGTRKGLDRWTGGKIEVLTARDGLVNDEVISLTRDRDGALWVGTVTGGLARLAGRGIGSLTRRDGLLDDTVITLLEDREGSLWVGSDGGLNRLSAGPFVPVGVPEGLSSDDVRPILQTRDGDLWIGTRGGGLNRRSAGTGSWKAYTHADGLPSDRVWSLYQDSRGDVWAGTKAGLARFHAGNWTSYTTAQGLAGDLVFSIAEDARGDLWIGTVAGLSRLRDGRFTNFGRAEGLSNERVYALLPASDGTLWIGTLGGGLDRLAGDRISSAIPSEEASFVFSLTEAGGMVLAGTGGRGLYGLAGGRWKRAAKGDGLFDDTVYTILDDGRGFLWTTSNRGVSRISRDGLAGFLAGRLSRIASTAFGVSDGMREAECNGGFQPAGWRAADGRLWFPTARGAVSVDPSDPSLLPHDPVVALERVVADERPVPPRGVPVLPPGTERFEFHYGAIDYRAGDADRFRYRLVGFDRDWIDADRRRVAYYTNLPAGTYRFEAAASNAPGRWIPTAPFDFRLRARFYRTGWFAALATAGILLGLVAVHRARIRSARLATELATARLQALKSQLQPHFLFNTLNLMLPLLYRDPEAAARTIVKLGDLLRASLERDATELVTLRAELELLQKYLDLERLRFHERIRTRLDVASDALEAAVPSFLLQPLIENAIKHAVARRREPTTLEVVCRREGGRLLLRIANATASEETRGRDGSLGVGLRNIRERLALVYGHRFEFTHSSASGRFVVELRLPYQPAVASVESESRVVGAAAATSAAAPPGNRWEASRRLGKRL